MKPDSFKWKISLLSLILSATVLIIFGLFFMVAIRRIGLERIDRELRVLADAQIRRPQPLDHWRHFEESMRTVYGDRSESHITVRVKSPDGRDLYLSPRWAAALAESTVQVPGPVEAAERDRLTRPPPPRPDPEPPDRNPPGRAGPPRMNVSEPAFSTVATVTGSWRVLAISNPEVILFIAMDLATFQAEINRFRNACLVAMPVALVLLACGGWLIAHRALRPVTLIAETAAAMTTRELDRRIPASGADREFARLIEVINGMLDRLEKSYLQAVRFSGDAAHELKTPLTILQGQLEQALQEAPTGSSDQQRYSDLLEEVRRLASITRKLLLLAQADSGHLRLSLAPFDLSAAVGALSDDIALMAPSLTLEKRIAPGLRIMADADLINQVLQNLVSNAIKYNRTGGWIRLTLEAQCGVALVSVSNSGVEIPSVEHDRVFERFYRGSKSRNRETAGTGLGLNLAREIVQAHKGELILEASTQEGTTFVMRIALLSNI